MSEHIDVGGLGASLVVLGVFWAALLSFTSPGTGVLAALVVASLGLAVMGSVPAEDDESMALSAEEAEDAE